jgi:hypothetical protein
MLNAKELKLMEKLIAKSKEPEIQKLKLPKLVIKRIEAELGKSKRVVLVRGNKGKVSVWGMDGYLKTVEHGKVLGASVGTENLLKLHADKKKMTLTHN